MTMILNNPSGELDRRPTKPGRAGFASPDKTVASTPPASPGGDQFPDTFDNNVFANGASIPAQGTTAARNSAPASPQGGGGCAGLTGVGGSRLSAASSIRKKNDPKQLLRVDKILCRVPSHESNISDLSASLSPNHPRGPALGSQAQGIRQSNTNQTGTSAGAKYQAFPPPNNKGEENIVYSLLNECGVFENVNDIMEAVGQLNGDDEIPPPPPTEPPPKVKKKSGWGACYEKPAVWGIAPEDDDSDGITEPTDKGSKVTQEPSIEYDNVELVLDETTLYPSYSHRSQTPVSGIEVHGSQISPPGSGGSNRNLKHPKLGRRTPPLIPSGRKSPGAGILKNKLSSVKNLGRKTPSPAPESVVTSTPPSITVVESKNDPRISHMYDIAQFDNEELRPSLEPSSGGSGNKREGNDTPVSTAVSGEGEGRATSPIEFIGAGKKSPEATPELVVNVSDLEGMSMMCHPVGGAPPPSMPCTTPPQPTAAIPTKVDLAMAASSGVHPTSEGEVEVDSAPLLKTEGAEKKKGKKLLKGLSFKPSKSVRSPKSAEGKGEAKKRSKSLGRLGKSTKSVKSVARNQLSKDDSSLPTSSAPRLSKQDIEDAKKWKATLDKNSGKYYYYHRETKEVSWEKPFGFDEANGIVARGVLEVGDEDTVEAKANSGAVEEQAEKKEKSGKKKIGLGGLGKSKKAVKAESSDAKDTVAKVDAAAKKVEAAAPVNDEAKAWRATLDASTGKTYYYNKRTKEVSWTKPPGFDDGKGSAAAENKKAEETAAMASVAEKRKKTWFKKKADKAEMADESRAAEAPVEDAKAVAENKAVAKEEGAGEVVDVSKYWRATSDPSTGKIYYFNKKTKMVTWTKPEGFQEKESGEKKEKAVAEAKADEAGAKEETKAAEPAPAQELVVDAGGAGDAVAEPQQDDESEIEGFTDEEAVDCAKKQAMPAVAEDAPFDEPEAPFDEPASPGAPSPKRAHFEQPQQTSQPSALSPSEDDEANEQKDSFDESDMVAGQAPLYGRVKSLKSIDFDGRMRTYASEMTDKTKKAANTAGAGRQGISKDDSATFESSLNNSSIASEIFTDNEGRDDNPRNGRRPPKHQSEVRTGKVRDNLPQLPATPPRSSRNARSSAREVNHRTGRSGSQGRRYPGKQAENLGDSSEEDTYEEHRHEEQDSEYWSDDDVSALSGIGNDSIESKAKRKKRREDERDRIRSHGRRSRSQGDERRKKSSREKERSSSRQKKEKRENKKPQRSDNPKEWTQQELDSFISKNDWGSVSKYINEMRDSKGNRHEYDQIAVRKQPSIREIQERIEYNRMMEGESSAPKTRFGARSQMQHDDISQDSPSRSGVESESVWQSLSSASYESADEESSSQYYRQQRRSRSSSRRRSSRSSPRELLM